MSNGEVNVRAQALLAIPKSTLCHSLSGSIGTELPLGASLLRWLLGNGQFIDGAEPTKGTLYWKEMVTLEGELMVAFSWQRGVGEV